MLRCPECGGFLPEEDFEDGVIICENCEEEVLEDEAEDDGLPDPEDYY